MKTIINKLFNKLGYLPKDEYKDYDWFKNQFNLRVAMDEAMQSNKARYYVSESEDDFMAVAQIPRCRRIVKVFKKKDNAEYARKRTEELCEILNKSHE